MDLLEKSLASYIWYMDALRSFLDTLTNKGEKEYDWALNDLQPSLWGSASQTSRTNTLVPARGMPNRVLYRPPNPGNKEEGPRESVASEAAHDTSQHLEKQIRYFMELEVHITKTLLPTTNMFI